MTYTGIFGPDEDRAVLVGGRCRIYYGESADERHAMDAMVKQGVEPREASYRVCCMGEWVDMPAAAGRP